MLEVPNKKLRMPKKIAIRRPNKDADKNSMQK